MRSLCCWNSSEEKIVLRTKPINGRSGKDERDEKFVCARENEVRVRRGSSRLWLDAVCAREIRQGFVEARYGALRLAKLMGLWARYITKPIVMKPNEAHTWKKDTTGLANYFIRRGR
ncbi:hypothetical protein F2Q69_00026750 [Brassica cretica]|uniref:Uncharacterized protein n=1 Tax=Brassica cretica TaxID=69181 RepID=A0A8S9RV36_BRACR|nr:hypothetical protein F2Q69_00026750 [Brassica cretica]